MSYCQKCGRNLKDLESDDEVCPKCGEKIPKGGCFIATACYGKDSEEVEIFRCWRDDILMKNKYGRRFVNIYYKISPKIANLISDNMTLKKMVRLTLNPIKETKRRY
jgi:predicted amidophosphoribosyltransferase